MPDYRDITVITPAKIRNEQELKWLREALDSIPPQVAKVIVFDHGYLHQAQILASLPEYQNLQAYELSDKTGLAAGRNEAMRHVKTPFFFPLDADDFLLPESLQIALRNYPGDGFLYGSTRLFDDKHEAIYKSRPYDICKLIEAVYWPNGCLQVTENFHRIGGWDESLILYEDWDYWLRSYEAGIYGHAIPDVLYCYRQNPNGIIHTLKRNPDMARRARQQIETRHKILFAEDNPMCCGKKLTPTKANMNRVPQPREIVIPPPTEEGLILLTYIGGGLTRSFYGASGMQYRFSSTSRKYGYVAEEDAPGLLAMQEGGHYLFTTDKTK